MSTYQTCDRSIGKTAERLMERNHPDLKAAGVTIGYLFAHAPRNKDGEPKGPAIRHQGYPALGVIKINSLKDRVEGKCDATMTLDGDEWDTLPSDQQEAIIDHELQHLEVRIDEDGAVQLDDANRPKLRIRLHDLLVGGFAAIVERHGDAAVEYQALRMIADKHGQGLFPFMAGEPEACGK